MSERDNPFAKEMDVVGISVLLNEGAEQGFITYDQILEAWPDIETNLSLLETIMEEAQAANIPIYENEEEADLIMSGSNGADDLAKDAFGKISPTGAPVDDSPHTAPLFDLSNVPIDDSVGLYFREMGQQGLLTADEEVTLAMEIEAGRAATIDLRSVETELTLDDQIVWPFPKKLGMPRAPILFELTPDWLSASPKSIAVAAYNSWI